MITPRKFPVAVREGFAQVKIYLLKRKGTTPLYSVDWWLDGKRNRKAFDDYQRAKLEAEVIVKKLATGDAMALQLTGADKVAYCNALETLKPSGVSLDIATARFAEAFKLLGGDQIIEACQEFIRRHPKDMPQKTVREVLDEMIEAKAKLGLSIRHRDDLESRCGAFAESFKCPLRSVTSSEVRQYLEKLDIAPRTFKNHFRSIQNLFAFAQARKYLPKDFDALDDIQLPTDKGGEIEIYTPEEIAAILAVASPDILPCLCLGAFAGLRNPRDRTPYLGKHRPQNRLHHTREG